MRRARSSSRLTLTRSSRRKLWARSPGVFMIHASVPLGLRHIAMHVEASRRTLSLALRYARLDRHAECLDLSNLLSADFTGHGFDAGVGVHRRRDRALAAPSGVYGHESQAGAL